MSVTATTSSGWILDSAVPEYEMAQAVEGLGPASSGKIWRRAHHVITRHQLYYNPTANNIEVGTTTTGNNIVAYIGAVSYSASAANTYLCTKDELRPEPAGSDIIREDQAWEYFSAWEEYTIPT